MDQQQQTKRFFESTASAWQTKASGEAPSYNIVEGRHRAVLAVLKGLGKVRRLLDVGCGTGQLTVEVARQGVDATGIDFAAEMIAQCEANRQKAGVAAKFINASFFDLPTPPEPYDIISAQGFIEYISPEQMEEFFARCSAMLRPGGHPWMSSLSVEDQRKEVVGGLTIRSAIGLPAAGFTFCYPYGDYNEDTLAELAGLGCAVAFTIEVALTSPTEATRLRLPRLDTIDLPMQADAAPNEWTRRAMAKPIRLNA
jgi:2-polyprenyl-3-methyl-5-hydroxy-6-metoxy-1,4-benzoquinol methylase